MEIQFLYFDGCPNHRTAFDLLTQVLKEKRMVVPIERICIKDDDDAVRHRFIGSPTIRISGLDIEENLGDRLYAKACRVYAERGRMSGLPTHEMIKKALEEQQ